MISSLGVTGHLALGESEKTGFNPAMGRNYNSYWSLLLISAPDLIASAFIGEAAGS